MISCMKCNSIWAINRILDFEDLKKEGFNLKFHKITFSKQKSVVKHLKSIKKRKRFKMNRIKSLKYLRFTMIKKIKI